LKPLEEAASDWEFRMSLETAVQELKDRVDILETMYEYCRHADNLNPDGMVALFVDDCVANFVPGSDDYLLHGKAELTRMYSWQRFTGHPMTADCHRWGRYENRFLRTPDGWRIARLKLISAGEYGGARIGEQLGRPFPPTFE
jgi:hypothetical protein